MSARRRFRIAETLGDALDETRGTLNVTDPGNRIPVQMLARDVGMPQNNNGKSALRVKARRLQRGFYAGGFGHAKKQGGVGASLNDTVKHGLQCLLRIFAAWMIPSGTWTDVEITCPAQSRSLPKKRRVSSIGCALLSMVIRDGFPRVFHTCHLSPKA